MSREKLGISIERKLRTDLVMRCVLGGEGASMEKITAW